MGHAKSRCAKINGIHSSRATVQDQRILVQTKTLNFSGNMKHSWQRGAETLENVAFGEQAA